ncbi:MAG: DUF1501 domain-containing protein [Gemmataceae bacterium]|nr:DUF1501 domain-containing protein [Gemmataceae bacterium]
MNPTAAAPRPAGPTRRELLQVGYSGLLGLTLGGTARASAAPDRRGKSVVIVFLTGAASHLETFDPKPDAVAEVRGEFGSVPTAVPGLRVCELLPQIAARADKFAVVRTLAHRDNNHTAATHHLMTGALQPGVRFDKPLSRDDWPCYAGGLSYLSPRADGVPHGVTLPTFLAEGPLVWPGQHGGFLGPRHDPWQITRDPNRKDFRVDNLRPADGLEVGQLRDRAGLLAAVNAGQAALAESAAGRRLTDQQQQALSVLTSGRVAKAFEIDREPPAVRDRYGRHAFGQSLLLARRLVEAGVSVVQANMGRVQNWDNHGDLFNRMKRDLLPPLDKGVSALLDDLTDRGMLDDTLVIVVGEFGREPKVNRQAGREHWAPCFSGLFAGGGVRGGQVIGRSDKTGGYPTTTPYSPDDLGATVYHVLGVDHESEVRDRLDRPVQLNRGRVITPLFGG